MNLLDAFHFLMMALFFAAHMWVSWEVWSGRSFLFVRLSSDLMGWYKPGELNEFTRTEQPLFYWTAIATKVFALAIIWWHL